jgi:hypothetical protein
MQFEGKHGMLVNIDSGALLRAKKYEEESEFEAATSSPSERSVRGRCPT